MPYLCGSGYDRQGPVVSVVDEFLKAQMCANGEHRWDWPNGVAVPDNAEYYGIKTDLPSVVTRHCCICRRGEWRHVHDFKSWRELPRVDGGANHETCDDG